MLQTFHHPHHRTQVTEAWPSNIKLLQHTLALQGIKVHALAPNQAADLPVAANSLDIITNSHAAFNPELIKDRLKTGGYFLTQQVGALNNYDLARFLDSKYLPPYPDNTLLQTVAAFQDLGFEIILAQEAQTKMQFFDVGAVVYYATVIPWEFPNFNVERCLTQLQQLEQILKLSGAIVTNEERFILIAKK